MKINWESLNRIDWANALFLTLTPLIGLGGTWILYSKGHLDGRTLLLALGMLIVTGLAITAGYHRLFSHKSYEASSIVKGILLFFGAASFENSALRWSSDHRTHHSFVDTDRDPYNIKRGFWFAHMGWVLYKYNSNHAYDNVSDLQADPLVKFQDRFYVPIGITASLLLPMGLGALWGDWLGGLIVAGFLRVVVNHHFTFSINSFAHLFGKQPYSDQNTSRDSWWLAFVTYGEGYHNFHHLFASDYRNGVRAHHWDPTKWLIHLLERLGQTSNLKRAPKEAILRARLRMEEKRVVRQLDHAPSPSPLSPDLVEAARLKIETAYLHFRAIKDEYHRLKAERMAQWSQQLHERTLLIQAQFQIAHDELKRAFDDWAQICRSFGVRPTRLAHI